jgi:hypothetical protein
MLLNLNDEQKKRRDAAIAGRAKMFEIKGMIIRLCA